MQNNPDLVRMILWRHLDNYKYNGTTKGRRLLQRLIKGIRKAQEAKEIRNDICPAMITAILFILTSGWF